MPLCFFFSLYVLVLLIANCQVLECLLFFNLINAFRTCLEIELKCFEFSAINLALPATAARQGGRVAAILVDSYEFGTAVNNEIEIIPACLPSAHALSMGCEWSVRAVASGVGDCCRGGMAVEIYNL